MHDRTLAKSVVTVVFSSAKSCMRHVRLWSGSVPLPGMNRVCPSFVQHALSQNIYTPVSASLLVARCREGADRGRPANGHSQTYLPMAHDTADEYNRLGPNPAQPVVFYWQLAPWTKAPWKANSVKPLLTSEGFCISPTPNNNHQWNWKESTS